MAKPAKLKTQAQSSAYVPQSRDECAQAIDQIGRLQRDILTREAAMNDEIADITERYAGSITEAKAEMTQLQQGVQSYCEANRLELTDKFSRKSASFTTGTVQWRQRPPSISVRGVDSVIDWLLNHGLSRFVREKREINKDALLNEPGEAAMVPGISIKSGVEDFVITPFEQELS